MQRRAWSSSGRDFSRYREGKITLSRLRLVIVWGVRTIEGTQKYDGRGVKEESKRLVLVCVFLWSFFLLACKQNDYPERTRKKIIKHSMVLGCRFTREVQISPGNLGDQTSLQSCESPWVAIHGDRNLSSARRPQNDSATETQHGLAYAVRHLLRICTKGGTLNSKGNTSKSCALPLAALPAPRAIQNDSHNLT